MIQEYLDYFLDSYEDCRESFIGLSKLAANKYLQVGYQSIYVPSLVDDNLTVDVFYKPAQKVKNKLLIMVSGVHGVEGHSGSAIQQFFLKEMMSEIIDDDTTGVLLIHGLNPYGFKYLRRVSENNIDLNRNFFKGDCFIKKENALYGKLDHLLNPQQAYMSKSIANYLLVLRNLLLGFKFGVGAFKKSLLSGQYEYEKGLYYGGIAGEPNKAILDDILANILQKYDRVVSIDLHTGYGEKNKLQLSSLFNSADLLKRFDAFFKKKGLSSHSKVLFQSTGSLSAYITGLVEKTKECVSHTFEFGTVSNHHFLSSIVSLKTLINENQAFHYGCKSKQDQEKIKNYFKEMFYPSDESWRLAVIRQVKDILPALLSDF